MGNTQSTKTDEICIVSKSRKYLGIIDGEIQRIFQSHNISNVNILLHHMRTEDPSTFGDIRRAQYVLLVATYSQRLIVISDAENSDMGAAYDAAEHGDGKIFLILAAHEGSNELPKDKLFDPSFAQLLKSQPKIKYLSEHEQFISIGTYHKNAKLNFLQEGKIVKWIREGQKERKMRSIPVKDQEEECQEMQSAMDSKLSVNDQLFQNKEDSKIKKLYVVGSSTDCTYMVKEEISHRLSFKPQVVIKAIHPADIKSENIEQSDFLLLVLLKESESLFLSERNWHRLQKTMEIIQQKNAGTFILLVDPDGDANAESELYKAKLIKKYEPVLIQQIKDNLASMLDSSMVCCTGRMPDHFRHNILSMNQIEVIQKWINSYQPSLAVLADTINKFGSQLEAPKSKDNLQTSQLELHASSEAQAINSHYGKLFIICPSKDFLKIVVKAIQKIAKERFRNMPIKGILLRKLKLEQILGKSNIKAKRKRYGVLCTSNQEEDSMSASDIFMLVGIGSQNMALISKEGAGQFGKLYMDPRLRKADTFLLLASHPESNNLGNDEIFDSNLQDLFDTQPEVEQLAKEKRFISIGTKFNEPELLFNKAQSELIITWFSQYF